MTTRGIECKHTGIYRGLGPSIDGWVWCGNCQAEVKRGTDGVWRQKPDETSACECAEIMLADPTRHFKGCPLREKYPTHAAEKIEREVNLDVARERNALLEEVQRLRGNMPGPIVMEFLAWLRSCSPDFAELFDEDETLCAEFFARRIEGREWLKPLKGAAAAVGPLLIVERLDALEERIVKESSDCLDAHHGKTLRMNKLEERSAKLETCVKEVCEFQRDALSTLKVLDERTAYQSKCDANNVDAIRQLATRIEAIENFVKARPDEAMAARAAFQADERRRDAVNESDWCARCGHQRRVHVHQQCGAVTLEGNESYQCSCAAFVLEARQPVFVANRASMPTVVCLCGSTRFSKAFADANLAETLAGKIVLTVGSMTHSDAELKITDAQKIALDALHLKKVEMSDEVLCLNQGGYIGDSTRSEIEHAKRLGKPIRYLEPI